MHSVQSQLSTWLTNALQTPELATIAESTWQLPRPTDAADSLPPGTILNGIYRIVDVLGRGGMGIVYRAVDQLHGGRVVALKTIKPDALTPQQIALFKTEFQTLTELHHPNVAAAHDFEAIRGRDGGAGYLFTMEYVEGRSIYDATATASWPDIVESIVPVCRALAYIHSRQLIHFDLKPQNVLVDGRGSVKVLDFGVAGVRHGGSSTEWRGTLHYMAPELANPDAQVDHRADLYSLGIMFYQLLCRRLPFDGRSVRRLVEQHHLAPLTFAPEDKARLPAWLRQIVAKLCAKLPADRYRSANAVIEDINRAGDRVYELETRQTRESYILSSRFVGRDDERSNAFGFIADRVRRGPTGLEPALFVSGASGVGKSRLLREVRLQAQLSHIPFLEGACYEGSFAEYGPLLGVIEHLVRLADTLGHDALVERHGPELVKLHPAALAGRGITASAPLENGELERQRLLDQVTEFFVRVADFAPYVICIDDLQWAASGTVDVLGYLIRRIALAEQAGERIGLAVLTSFRDDEVEGRPLATMLSERTGQYASLPLRHLAGSHVGQLLGSMLGIEQLPDAFVVRVTEETAGNAFFVEEVMRTLIENGSVYLERGEWATRERIGDLPIPHSVEAVFRRRASFLDGGARVVLDLMSVHGQPIHTDLLQAASGFEPHTLHTHLGELHRRQMVQQVAGETPRYALLHDRMRETLYRDLGADERRACHIRIGEAIEGRSDAAGYAYELAHHFWHAGDSERGFTYCLRAGELAERGYANDRAIEFFERTLQLLPQVRRADAPALEARIWETLGDLFALQGKFAQAVTRYQTVLASASATRDRARLSRKLGQVYWQRGELGEAVTALWNAVEQVGEKRPKSKLATGAATLASVLTHVKHRAFGGGRHTHHDTEERSRLLELTTTYFSLGEVYFFHDPSEMLLPLVRAANRGESAGGDSKQLVVAYSGIMVVYGTLTMWGSATRYAQKLADMAERLGSDWHIGIGHTYWLILHYYRAKWADGIDAGYRARDLLLRCGDMAELSFVYWLLALCHYYRGNLHDALAIAQEGVATMARADSQQPSKGILAVAARIQARLGDVDAAKDLIGRSTALCQRSHDRFFSTWVEMMKGDCHLLAGELDEAIGCLERARASRETHGLLPEYLVEIYPLLAAAKLEQYRMDRERLDAAPQRRRLDEISGIARKGTQLCRRRHCYYAPALRVRAAAAALAGENRPAANLFARSLAHAEMVGATLQLGETHFEMGRCLIDAGQREQARPHLEAARALFETAGARTLLQRVAPLIG